MKVTMSEIMQATENYAMAARDVRNLKEKMEDGINQIQKSFRESLVEACKNAAEAEQMVRTLLESEGAAGFFIKPKTININGITVGFRKKEGKYTFADEQNTIELIKQKIPEKAAVLVKVKTEQSIFKTALNDLTGDELKKIGVSVVEDTDEPFVKISDSAVQKAINAMMKEMMKDAA